jgi:hypothetical protein
MLPKTSVKNKKKKRKKMAPRDRASRRVSKLLLAYGGKSEATSWTMTHTDKVARLERVAQNTARSARTCVEAAKFRHARHAKSALSLEWQHV